MVIFFKNDEVLISVRVRLKIHTEFSIGSPNRYLDGVSPRKERGTPTFSNMFEV